MNLIEKTGLSERVLFWIIVLSSIIVVFVLVGSLSLYRFQDKRAKATLAAIPTMTAESLESLYQKGVGYINIEHWQQAKMTLDLVFEIDPNYKDIQTKLIEVDEQIARLNVTPIPTRSEIEHSIDNIASTNGLIAYYPFNGNANNESGNGNPSGLANNTILTEDRFGVPNSAYRFNGDGFINIGDNLDIEDNSLTLLVWIKSNNYDQYAKVINKGQTKFGNPPNSGYSLRFLQGKDTTSGKPELWLNIMDDNGHREVVTYPSHQLETNRFIMITGVYDRSTTPPVMGLWINDAMVATKEVSLGYSDTNIPLAIGALYRGGHGDTDELFVGVIDDVRIYNRALSEVEIQELYHENGWQ